MGNGNHFIDSDSEKEMEKSKTSFVKDLIDFKARENSFWRKKDMPSVESMLKDIIKLRKQWQSN